ncbi:cbb3-type cytochrome c oxidase subunit I [Comamonas sp. NLF-1-9]|uniref:cbb3-type cytochrome c oxidase subunit I n=1 Tax=Comamonas sp. NLF-1-9 TaxID=2853163 RepID=UPI001C46C3D5|nr:cbb3-type cytochrome c oxidase subunit I [Comamonas sp. NLF-1-9]QXL85018.1 cbb3-type cytochrome c oxidase subunit I [Comamonas sp. NLF-1-9]
MDSAVVSLLSAFVLSLIGLFVFMWSMRKGLFVENPKAAGTIFAPGEVGKADDPSLTPGGEARLQQAIDETQDKGRELMQAEDPQELEDRIAADRSTSFPAFMFIGFAVMWLVVGSLAGLTASLKLHWPDWLVGEAWETFGRMRTYHLTAVLYGWITNCELGIIVWLLPRLMRTPLRGPLFVMMGGALINVGIASAIGGFGAGWTAGMEYLEIPWQIGIFLVAGFICIIIPVISTVVHRKAHEIYVSAWYHVGSLLWIALLFTVAKFPGAHYGVEQATMNWWYGHNVLGLWFTPAALGAIYYFLPKVIGRRVSSYNLSILGFWTLAFFYAQVGGHHLVGGPVPEWLITLSIVQSMMMIVPVAAFSVNMAGTMWGRMKLALYSPTLRFMMFGGFMYMLSSVQGSFEALRSVNRVAHFTHFTVAHAHLGAYGFVTMVLFGAVYFMLPRILRWEWPFPKLISWHFWLAAIGILIYFGPLTYGGWLQGLAMLDESKPFMDSVTLTIPYLYWRSIGGSMMVASHLIFAFHVLVMVLRFGPNRTGAALFNHEPRKLEVAHGK